LLVELGYGGNLTQEKQDVITLIQSSFLLIENNKLFSENNQLFSFAMLASQALERLIKIINFQNGKKIPFGHDFLKFWIELDKEYIKNISRSTKQENMILKKDGCTFKLPRELSSFRSCLKDFKEEPQNTDEYKLLEGLVEFTEKRYYNIDQLKNSAKKTEIYLALYSFWQHLDATKVPYERDAISSRKDITNKYIIPAFKITFKNLLLPLIDKCRDKNLLKQRCINNYEHPIELFYVNLLYTERYAPLTQ